MGECDKHIGLTSIVVPDVICFARIWSGVKNKTVSLQVHARVWIDDDDFFLLQRPKRNQKLVVQTSK